MKRLLLSFVLVLSVLSLSAQDNRTDSIREKVFESKVNEMVTRLKLTDEQRTAFVPIYKSYNEDMRAVMGKRKKWSKPTSSKEAAELIKNHLERQKKAIDVREKYIDKLSTVLDAGQLSRFLRVENRIQFQISQRKYHKFHNGKGRMKNGQMEMKKW
ncbi:MAG: Spy/CpxP family protein refolding chaperone [Prevotella sp.]|nr:MULTISPECIES: Spy/CpxP family protein refolding chaperone [unclassified Prevotella]MCH3970184.1 Spy/CpxP family protein refolding chaperone [Prevotella sp.]MCH3992455.1 Spy/CpxP family protein refolding chaperone [Prevotella sp.]MCH4016945.1 Spy/CpxP family protein refolding chaperone [Prevotella sp.]MCH4099011.1 Spy/CpxP family protein refolding chaperone [Prevotella sp.]MCH4186225.1 Spy/CpxP family protein refolding chaperone [Prevotella sp.]